MMNMPGFNMGGPAPSAAPFQMLSPEVLAQLAAAGFRPGQGQAPGLPGFNVRGGGGDLGAGMAGLGAGLGAYSKMGGGNPFMAAQRTAGDADLGGYGQSPVNPDGTPVMGNPNAQPIEVFNPTGAAKGSGFGKIWDFLTGWAS